MHKNMILPILYKICPGIELIDNILEVGEGGEELPGLQAQAHVHTVQQDSNLYENSCE